MTLLPNPSNKQNLDKDLLLFNIETYFSGGSYLKKEHFFVPILRGLTAKRSALLFKSSETERVLSRILTAKQNNEYFKA